MVRKKVSLDDILFNKDHVFVILNEELAKKLNYHGYVRMVAGYTCSVLDEFMFYLFKCGEYYAHMDKMGKKIVIYDLSYAQEFVKSNVVEWNGELHSKITFDKYAGKKFRKDYYRTIVLNPPTEPIPEYNATCPLCGAEAMDFVVSFECSNPGCQNRKVDN